MTSLTWTHVLATRDPGREQRRNEPFCRSCKEAASQLLPVVEPKLTVRLHGLPTLCSFEMTHPHPTKCAARPEGTTLISSCYCLVCCGGRTVCHT